MAAFGAGTLPAMLGLISIIPMLTKRFNLNLTRLMVVMQVVAGCLLIVRVWLVEPGEVHKTTAGVDQISVCP
jgi:sulfite exporter TauE/SafE